MIAGTIDPAASVGGPSSDGVYTVVVTVSDGNGGSVTDTFTYTVGNPPPVAGDDTFSTAEDTAVSGTVSGGDADTAPDSDPLGYSLVTGTSNGTLALNPDGTFTYTPTANFNGTDTFTYQVSDGQGGTDTATVTITVTPVNDRPVADDETFTVAEDGAPVVLDLLTGDTDVEGDTLTIVSIAGTPITPGVAQSIPVTGGTVEVSTSGVVTFTPAPNYNGPVNIDYVVSDGTATDTGSVSGTVTPVNDAPIVVDPLNPSVPPLDPDHVIPLVSGVDGTPITPINVTSYFGDIDGDILTLSIDVTTLPPGIVFDPTTGTFAGTPSPDASQGGPASDGTYAVVITAVDGNGGVVTTTITFHFDNPPPIAGNDFAVTNPDTPITINVLGNDRDGGLDGDALTVTAATSPNGSVTINGDGTLTFEPAPGFAGVATITYVISDGQGGTATATVTVLVIPVTAVTGTTDVQVPTPQPLVFATSGIETEGIIVQTVQNVDSLGSIGGTLSANGIILATANQISNLGGIGGGRLASSDRGVPIGDTAQLWRVERDLGSYHGHDQGTWEPKGLTGFSLRFTFAEDAAGSGKAQIVLESLVRERTLIVRLSSTELPGSAHVVDYSVMQADGRPLPLWLDRSGSDLLIGNRPAHTEELKLRVVATMSDGTTLERHVVIQTTSGEIQPLELEKRADIAPTFSQQLEKHASRSQMEFERLAEALAE